jgi:hypothetical protein
LQYVFSPFGEIGSCSIFLSYQYQCWSTSTGRGQVMWTTKPSWDLCVVFSWRWIVLLHIFRTREKIILLILSWTSLIEGSWTSFLKN